MYPDDPIQLQLLYEQSRDSFLAGSNPCEINEAIPLSALMCQIKLGDFDTNVHQPESLKINELLPLFIISKYQNSIFLEEEVLSKYKKLVGMSSVNAQYGFLQLYRALKTYGITLFEITERVKEQNRSVRKLLGITRNAILFLEFNTKAIEREYPITELHRWAVTPTSITFDFNKNDYVVVITTEGGVIAQLISGYIDILLRKHTTKNLILSFDEKELLNAIQSVQKSRSKLQKSILHNVSDNPLEELNDVAKILFHSVTQIVEFRDSPSNLVESVNKLTNDLDRVIDVSKVVAAFISDQSEKKIEFVVNKLQNSCKVLCDLMNFTNFDSDTENNIIAASRAVLVVLPSSTSSITVLLEVIKETNPSIRRQLITHFQNISNKIHDLIQISQITVRQQQANPRKLAEIQQELDLAVSGILALSASVPNVATIDFQKLTSQAEMFLTKVREIAHFTINLFEKVKPFVVNATDSNSITALSDAVKSVTDGIESLLATVYNRSHNEREEIDEDIDVVHEVF